MRNQALPAMLANLDLAGRHSVIVAVSGGSDSLALLLLGQAHFQHTNTRLVAVTIDHCLREGSAGEAEGVAALCAARGIEHRILRWSGPKPASGLAAAAREARYRLLAKAADEADSDLVLTGHTRDDQAETIFMRGRRGDGRGLAGMAPATLYDGRIWVLRPLLGCRRAELRQYLRERGVHWVDDPTNSDMNYERVRIRAEGVAMSDAQITSRARQRSALSAGIAAAVKRHAALVSPGLVRLAPEFAGGEQPVAVETLRLLLAVTGGVGHLVDAARTQALFDRIGQPLRATLSRSVVDVRRSGIFLYREARGLPAPAPFGEGMTWDGRFRICGQSDGMVEPLGREQAAAMAGASQQAPRGPARSALAAWPALRHGCGLLTPLGHDGLSRQAPRAIPCLSPWVRFMPCFDIAAAASVADLIGAPPIPPLPFVEDIAMEH